MELFFSREKIQVVDERNNQLSELWAIVIKDNFHHIHEWTDYGVFCHFFEDSKPANGDFYTYVSVFLNYLFKTCNVCSLSEITPEILERFFQNYKGRKNKNGEFVGPQTMDRCISAVSNFAANIAESSASIPYSWSDYLIKYDRKSPGNRSRRIYVYASKFSHIQPLQDNHIPQLREMPFIVVEELIRLAKIYDPMITFAIAAGYYAGLRGGEIVNLRQPGSPLDGGMDCIRISPSLGDIRHIYIDLNAEYILRSDGVQTGRIKKERTVEIYKNYIAEFYSEYAYHLNYISNIPCEEEYRPLFIGRGGKAMTVQTLRNRFQTLVRNHLVPWLLNSGDPELHYLGNRLLNENLGLHVLRHCFTCRLLLDTNNTVLLKEYRGDSSTKSAEVYYANKGIIAEMARIAHGTALSDMTLLGSQLTKENNLCYLTNSDN